jgi:hypothetical protein
MVNTEQIRSKVLADWRVKFYAWSLTRWNMPSIRLRLGIAMVAGFFATVFNWENWIIACACGPFVIEIALLFAIGIPAHVLCGIAYNYWQRKFDINRVMLMSAIGGGKRSVDMLRWSKISKLRQRRHFMYYFIDGGIRQMTFLFLILLVAISIAYFIDDHDWVPVAFFLAVLIMYLGASVSDESYVASKQEWQEARRDYEAVIADQ